MFVILEKDRLEVLRKDDAITMKFDQTPGNVIVEVISRVAEIDRLKTARITEAMSIFTLSVLLWAFHEKYEDYNQIFAALLGYSAVLLISGEFNMMKHKREIQRIAEFFGATFGPRYDKTKVVLKEGT